MLGGGPGPASLPRALWWRRGRPLARLWDARRARCHAQPLPFPFHVNSQLPRHTQEVVDEPDTLVFVLIDEVESLTSARCVGATCWAGAGAGLCWIAAGVGRRSTCLAWSWRWRQGCTRASRRLPAHRADPAPSRPACSKAAVSGSEPTDAIRAVNSLLTRLDQLKASPNVMVRHAAPRWACCAVRCAAGVVLCKLCCAVSPEGAAAALGSGVARGLTIAELPHPA